MARFIDIMGCSNVQKLTAYCKHASGWLLYQSEQEELSEAEGS
jgi:hypothetical protein